MKKYLLLIAMLALSGASDAQKNYTLQSCLREGIEKNYSVRIARTRERISDNNATRANAGALPEIGVSAGYSGNLTDTRTSPREGEATADHGTFNHTLNAGLDLEWTIFNGFSIRTDYRRLQQLQKQGELDTRIAIEDFVAELTAEYYNYVQQRIRLRNFRYAMSLSKERLRIVMARLNVGSFSGLDLMQARVDFNSDSSKFINQQELVYASRIRLNELMAAENVDAQISVTDSLIRVDKTLQWDRLLDDMQRTNASLLRADRDRTLAELDLRTVQARNYPYVRFNAGYGYTLNRYGSGSTLRRHTLGPDAGLSIGLTIFDGNRRREQRNARLQIESARLGRQQIELSLRADLANFWQAYRNNIELMKLEEENLIVARENYSVAMDRYMLGDLAGIDMREAQKSLLDAEERILTAQYNTKLCEISLLQVSGTVLNYLE